MKSKPSENVKPSLHGEPSQREPSPESGDVKELETGERKLDSDDMNKSNVGEINQLESVNKCEVEQKSNTGESEEVQVREVGRKEEQNLKTVEVNEVKVDEVKVDEVKVNEVKVNEVEVNEFELSEVEENEVEGNEIEVGLEARVKSANFGGHNNSESQQSDQVAVDLFDEFNLGGCEDAVDLDLIDVSGNLNLESPEEGNRSDSESCSSSEKSDDEHSMDVSLFSDTSRNSNNKPKRPLFEQCLLCDKSVRKMRDHLNYFHKLKSNPVLKNFLSSYYSTIQTKKCYQCEDCVKRLGFKQSYPKHHRLARIFNRKDWKCFPENIQVALKGYQESKFKPYSEVVDEFDSHCQGLANEGEVLNVSKMSSNFKNFLSRVILDTKEFEETTKLSSSVRHFQESNGLKRITMCSYLGRLKKFFNFLELHAAKRFPHFKTHSWDKVLDELRVRVQIGAQKEKKRMKKELQSKVPSLTEVQRVSSMITDFLNKDLADKKLKYKELSAMNFLILAFRLNCRSGPLLNLTWEHVRTIKKTGSLDTDQHKTGRYYDVTIKIENDQHAWLKRLRKQYIREFVTHSDLVFPTALNTVDHSMSRTIRSVLTNIFGDSLGKDFHANSVRKMWDTHFYKNKENLGSAVFTSHLEQTGHTEATALRNYVVPGDKTNTLNIYLNALSNIVSSTPESNPHLCSTSATPAGNHPIKKTTPLVTTDKPAVLEKVTPHAEVELQVPNGTETPCVKSDRSKHSATETPKPGPKRGRNSENGTPNTIVAATDEVIDTPLLEARPKRQKHRQLRKAYYMDSEEPESDGNWEVQEAEYKPNESEDSSEEDMKEVPAKKGEDNKRRERFINSLKTSRKHKPSPEEQRCLALFYYVKAPIRKIQLIATIKKSGIKIDEQTLNRVYNKVKFASNEYLKNSMEPSS